MCSRADLTPVKLAYIEFEPNEGADTSLTPIIFLHGLTAIKEYWSDIPQVIADGTKRKAYAIDARNHGASEYLDEFTFDHNVVDLFHFMDTINIPKAILIGHSMGGITSIKAALQKPERVEVMISEDMFAKKVPQEIINPICAFINLWIASVHSVPKELSPTEAASFAVDLMISQLPENTPHLTNKDKMKNLAREFNRTPEGGYDVKFNKTVILRALQNIDETMSEISGQYHGPSYFIYGGISPFNVGNEEENIKNHFPIAELIEIEGATHNVHMEFPEQFIETVIQRLTQHSVQNDV